MKQFMCILGLISTAILPNALHAQTPSSAQSEPVQPPSVNCSNSNSGNTTKGAVAGAVLGAIAGNAATRHHKTAGTILGGALGAVVGAKLAGSTGQSCEATQSQTLAPTNPASSSAQNLSVNQEGHQFIAARDFTFTLIGCNLEGADVSCELKLVNTADVDHTLMIVGAGNCCTIAEYVKTETGAIDMAGGYHKVSDIQIANNSAKSYESNFRITPGIEYKIKLRFTQIGYHAASLARVAVGAGEHYDNDGDHTGYELPIVFKSVPIIPN